jgi:hypothetical protein
LLQKPEMAAHTVGCVARINLIIRAIIHHLFIRLDQSRCPQYRTGCGAPLTQGDIDMEASQRKVSRLPPATRDEELTYLRQMLRELLPIAANHDALLASFVEMAVMHSTDILAGVRRGEPAILRK